MADATDGIDLASLIQGASNFADVIKQQTAAILSGQSLANDAAAASTASETDAANLNADVTRLKGTFLLDRSAQQKTRLSTLGANIDQSNSYALELNNRINAQTEDIKKTNQEYQKKLAIGFTDNPLQWLVNQFTLPVDSAVLNAKVAAKNADQSRLTDLIQNSSQLMVMNNSTDADTSAALVAKASAATLASAMAKVKENQQQMAIRGLAFPQAIMAANEADLNTSFKLFNARTQQQQLQLALNQDARASIESELNRQMKTLQIAALQENQDAQIEFTNRLNKARAVYGLQPTSWKAFVMEPANVKEKWQQIASTLETNMGAIAKDPITAVGNLSSVGIANLSGAPQLVVEAVHKAADDAMHKFATTWMTLKPEQKDLAIREEFNTQIQNAARNIPETGSLLSPAPLQTFMKNPVLQKSQIMQTMLPAASDPNMPVKPQMFMDQARNLIKLGKMDEATAASEISTIFRTVAQTTADTKQFQRLGIPLTYGQHFNTTVEVVPGGIGALRAGVDMTNPTAVMNTLLRMRNLTDQNGSFTDQLMSNLKTPGQ